MTASFKRACPSSPCFEVQALSLQGSEQLFDAPPRRVPIDYLAGHGRIRDRMRGQQPPVDAMIRWDVFGLDLDDVHGEHRDAAGRLFAVGRAPELEWTEAHLET